MERGRNAMIRTRTGGPPPALPVRADYKRFLIDATDYWEGRTKEVSAVGELLAKHCPPFNLIRRGNSSHP